MQTKINRLGGGKTAVYRHSDFSSGDCFRILFI
jgi:hypothetical protein